MDELSKKLQAVHEQFSCEHPQSEVRWVEIAGGSIQYVEQCLRCGDRSTRPIKKEIALKDGPVPEFDAALRDAWRKARADALKQVAQERDKGWWQWYSRYLDSPEWRAKRAKVLMRANGWCEGCLDAKATQVHHISYEHVGDELLWELVAVCDACHERAHNDKQGQS